MLTVDQKRKLGAIGLFAAPIVLIKVAAMLLGGPRATQGDLNDAAAGDALAILKATAAPTYTSQQQAAAQYVQILANREFGASPLYYTPRIKTAPKIEDPQSVQIVDPIAVRSIVSTERGETALIHGRVYSPGDLISDTDWIISRIDAHRRLVVFRNASSGEIALREVELPAAMRISPKQ